MICSVYRRRIALYVEGDISKRQALRIEHHVGGCKRCRTFLGEIEESQEAVRLLKGESVSGDLREAVRNSVLERVATLAPERSWGGPRLGARIWQYGVVGMVLATIGVALLYASFQANVDVSPNQMASVAQSEEQPVVVSGILTAGALEAALVSEPIMVKMLTDDPDVVIIWLADAKGGER